MKNNINKADIIGITASITCAVHCSILPLAIAYGFLGSSFMTGHGVFEIAFIILSIVIASYALWGSFSKNHKNPIPLISFISGIICIGVGLMYHGYAEIVLATAGGIIIAMAHYYNLLLNKGQLKNIF